MDEVTEMEDVLSGAGYTLKPRDPCFKPEFPGSLMLTDDEDNEGYAIIGNSREGLVREAFNYMGFNPIAKE